MDDRSKIYLTITTILLVLLFFLYVYSYKINQWKWEYVRKHMHGKVEDYKVTDDLTIRWVPVDPSIYVYTREGIIHIDLSKREVTK